MEASSTDKRIDDLSGRVGRFEEDVKGRFDKVDRKFDRFEDKVDARFDKFDARFDKLDARFDKLDARFDRWGKIVGGGVVTAVGAIIAGVIAKVLGL